VDDLMQDNASARVFLSTGQKIGLAIAAVITVVVGVVFGVTPLLQGLAFAITGFYLLFVGLKLVIWWAGARLALPQLRVPYHNDSSLPTYTIMVPMVFETEEGFRNLVKSLSELSYPIDKLQILLLLEEHDTKTVAMVQRQQLPAHFQLVVTPDVGPRTKPKACNYAMQFVKGDRTVIFDFEDRPTPDHLLRAVATLDKAHQRDSRVKCVQGRLQFWNTRTGMATPFYWGEYIVHFVWTLPGMAALGLVPPLGGTSNHFFTSALREVGEKYGSLKWLHEVDKAEVELEIPEVWDSYNVTEDADLAGRMARMGMRIVLGNFVTFEEAPRDLRTAHGQRSRWTKGFMQTFLVQVRYPLDAIRQMGLVPYLSYLLFIGGTPFAFLINPIVWGTTLLYLVSRLANWQGVVLYIEGLFPDPLYYTAMAIAIFGNGALLLQKLVTPLRMQQDPSFNTLKVPMQEAQHGLVKFLLLTPLWWMFTTLSAYKALFELVNPRKRSYWNKTAHSYAVGEEADMLGDGQERAIITTGNGAGYRAFPEPTVRQPQRKDLN
jgi:cellulose synthase/poly-beta-1,6-N-acetylglucosamine synthase-like glycosyltransferase